MDNINIRNILLVIGAVLLVVVGVNFISSIVPIALTAIIAFVLGRLSANRSMGQLFRSAQTASSSVMTAASKIIEEKPASTVLGKTSTPTPAPVVEKPVTAAAKPDLKNPQLLDPDFEIKTPEEIEAEARRLEAEVSQKATAYDPKAALEERKKRLLGDKGNQ